jgi:uncharacterized protein (TIGR03435 family)
MEIAMKNFLLWTVALAALSGDALLAQDLAGTWQGTLTLPGGKELRTVVKVTKGDGGAMKGVFYSIDQGGQSVPVSTVTLQGSAVKMSIPAIGGSYEGKLEADGDSITGNFSQGPTPLPLNLKRATPQTAWAIPEPPPPPKPMAADATPEFEVATIKPATPDRQGKGFMVRGRQFSTVNTTLADLMTFAYGIHAKQITGAPAWVETEKFDLAAQPNGEGQPNDKQWKAMVQKLLADRFKLAFHRDKKELSVYAIVVGKNGPKLTKSESTSNLPGLFFRGLGNLPAINATMADFAGVMQGAVLDRPVVDQTGLTGRWDFTLLWTPDEFQFAGLGVKPPPPPANNAAAPPDLFTAFQEQLGLKLEATKAQAEVFVIDKVAKPTEN